MKLTFKQKLSWLVANKNARLFLILTFLQNCWFTEAVWFFYWGRFANYTQLGILFSVLTVCWVIAEIPTGFFADRYGRKPAVILGYVCLIIGGIFIALSQNIWWLLIGGLWENIGRAFISGALEALLYDDLVETGHENYFSRLVSLRTQVGIGAYSLAVIIGGFAYTIYFRLPSILGVITAMLAMATSFSLKEKTFYSAGTVLRTSFLSDIVAGIKQLGTYSLRPFLIPIFLMSVVSFVFDWGFSRPAMALNFGFDSRSQSILYAVMSILAAIVVGYIPKLRQKFSDNVGINYLNVIMSLGFMMSFLKLGWYGLSAILAIELTWNLAEPWISIIINNQIESRLRATTLSTVQFLSKLPFVIINFSLGEAVDGGTVAKFHLILGLVMLICILANSVYFGLLRKVRSVIRLYGN